MKYNTGDIMNKLKYALIGCGRISPNHIAACLNNSDKFEIAAVCDVSYEKMDSLCEKFGINALKYTDYKKMLSENDIDIAAVATESGKHAQISQYVLERGVNVIIEKPMALSLSDADRLINTAEEKNLMLCVCHQNRFNRSVQKIRSALEEGRFGRLFHGAAHIRWNRGKEYYDQASWRGTWEQDGGALMNQCIHNIDLLRWMMGDDIIEVSAYTDRLSHDYIEAEDLGIAIVKFANGSYGIIEGTTNVYPSNLEETLYIFGEKGTVKAGGKSVNIIEEWKFADSCESPEQVMKEYSENPPNVYGYGHSPLYADAADAVLKGRKPYVDGMAGRRALELVLAVYKSAEEGRKIEFPLNDIKTTDFKGRFK